MNAVELLKNNHEMVLALINGLAQDIKQIEQTEQDTVDCERLNMFGELRDMLTQHTRLEEQMLYPELAGSSETRLLVDESYREHQRIREILAKMEKLRKDQHCERWDDKLKELQQNLKHHVARGRRRVVSESNATSRSGQTRKSVPEDETSSDAEFRARLKRSREVPKGRAYLTSATCGRRLPDRVR